MKQIVEKIKKNPIKISSLFTITVVFISFFCCIFLMSFAKFDSQTGFSLPIVVIGSIFEFACFLTIPIVLTVIESIITYKLYSNNVYILQDNEDEKMLFVFELITLIVLMIGEWIVVLFHYPAGGFLNFNTPPDTILYIVFMLLYLLSLFVVTCFSNINKKIFYSFMIVGIVYSITTLLVPIIINGFAEKINDLSSLIFFIIVYFPFLPINLTLIFLRVVKLNNKMKERYEL